MLYTTIGQLLESGKFTIQKTADLHTIITSKEVFAICGDHGNQQASLNESKQYQVKFSGLCTSGKLPYQIYHTNTPLFTNVLAEASRIAAEKAKHSTQDKPQLLKTTFGELTENQNFFLNDLGEKPYVKTGQCTFVNANKASISSKFELVSKPTREVFVKEQFDYTELTPDQKLDIVKHVSPNLDFDGFAEEVAMQLEDIPGMELMSEEQTQALITELFSLYTGN